MDRTYESAAALVGNSMGPLAGHLPRFVECLIRQQYVPAAVHVKARHAVAFDRWLVRRHVALVDVAEHHPRTMSPASVVVGADAEAPSAPRPGSESASISFTY